MLKKVTFKNNKYLYVDCEYLKTSYENGRLQGASVFARLFDLIQDDLFVPQNKDEYDLTHYDIYIEDWILFYSFVRNGYIQTTYDLNENLKDLNYCYDICIKFGGVPQFEKYYCEFFTDPRTENEINETVYNPMTPQEDIKNIYIWRSITSFTAIKPNESVTVLVCSEPVTVLYARRPREPESVVL